ncbi:MAG TPA: hypothetical protein VNN25_14145 [Thermoanaerobaculia bacterium]|nr:hypothetical protein [Thermoanaerobaculia bacterium]
MAERKSATTHTDAVQALVEETRAMRDRVPNLVIPSKGDRRRLAPAASVPPAFVERTAVAVTNSAALVRGGGLDPARTRDLMDFSSAYLLWADELEATAEFVRHSAIAARNQAGSDALTTFALARRLAKPPENADLAPHVEDMRRALGRTRKGKSKPAPEPAAEPTSEDNDTTPAK